MYVNLQVKYLIMASIRFYIEKRTDKKTGKIRTTNVPIFLSFTFQRKRLILYTQERINIKDWDFEKQRVKSHVRGATQINAYLESLADEVKGLYRDIRTRRETPTVQFIRENLSIRKNISNRNFYDILDEFIDVEGKMQFWTKGTITKFNTLKKHIQNFSQAKRYAVEFDSLNEHFFTRFTDYLIQDCNHINSYVSKNIKNLKWFLNWTRKRGYNKNLYYLDFSLPKTKSKVSQNNIITLTWDELIHLYGLKIDSIALDHVRDIFCFLCFTSLRYSDVYNLKKSNIHNDFILFETIKTSSELGIPLNDLSKALLKKYENFPGDKVFPVISNQKMNGHLKTIGKMAGFNDRVTIVKYRGSERIEKTYHKWELLSTHVGRKTFITIAIQLNIPTEVIMAITGHQDHKMLERYYRITNPHKTAEMAKFSKSYMKIAK